jgi:hypothetical protein
MHQPVNGLAGSKIKINSAKPGKANQKEELARGNKWQIVVYRLAKKIISLCHTVCQYNNVATTKSRAISPGSEPLPQ